MWERILLVNSVLLIVSTLYLIYEVGTSLLRLSWQHVPVALLLFIVLFILEFAFNILADS